MRSLLSYYQQLFRRFGVEFWSVRGKQLVLVLSVNAVVLILTWNDPLSRNRFKVTVVANAITFGLIAVWHLIRAPWLLHRDGQGQITELEEVVRKQNETIRSLTTKPKRTPAEQHHYDVAKQFIDKHKQGAVIALRHLKSHGRLTFGLYPPPLPEGMPHHEALNVYVSALGAGLVAKQEKRGSGEQTFEIAPTMNNVLDELLYESTEVKLD